MVHSASHEDILSSADPNTFIESASAANGSRAAQGTPQFSTKEFARVICIIVEGRGAIRRGLLESRKDFTRADHDKAAVRDAVWAAKIPPKVNDPNTLSHPLFSQIFYGVS